MGAGRMGPEKSGDRRQIPTGLACDSLTRRKKKTQVSTSLEEKKLGRDSCLRSTWLYEKGAREQGHRLLPHPGRPQQRGAVRILPGEAEAEGDTDEEIYFKELAHMTVGLARAAWQAGRSRAGADTAVRRWNLPPQENPSFVLKAFQLLG